MQFVLDWAVGENRAEGRKGKNDRDFTKVNIAM